MFLFFRNSRLFVALIHDTFWAIIAFWISISLRYGVWFPSFSPITNWMQMTLLVVLAHVFCYQMFGLYKGVWRFCSLEDLVRVLKSSTVGVLISILLIFFYNRLLDVPRSIFFINWLVLIMGLGGGRFGYRFLKDRRSMNKFFAETGSVRKNVLIVGAGMAGERIFREIRNDYNLCLNVVGFIDDNDKKHGRTVHGTRILGSVDSIPGYAKELNVVEVLVAIPSATSDELRKMVEICKEANIQCKTLPKMNDIISGKVEFSLFRNIQLEDLLGREVVKLDMGAIGSMIIGKSVMITGAGGSIGSELCRQISRFKPNKVILFEICEFFLYELEMNLNELYPEIVFIPVIGDVRNRIRVSEIMGKYLPNIVLHAAAYKHVPMMEKNPIEAINTNIFGTNVVASESIHHNVEKFVMISTDKAINPTNVMGTSKRIAEMVCQGHMEKQSNVQFITVRFGNVLGSTGSVVPLFKKQIENGGPVTVTHPDITRYFMSIPEACRLVLQAGAMGNGGEIFVLNMGEPVRIVDLAREMIELSGLKEGKDIEIKFTGLRKGEKLYEELFSDHEHLIETGHEKVKIARIRPLIDNFEFELEKLLNIGVDVEYGKILSKLKSLVPEFTPDYPQDNKDISVTETDKGM